MADRIDMTVDARVPILSGSITRKGGLAFELTDGDTLETADIDEVRLRVRERDGEAGTYKIDSVVSSYEVSADGKSIDWTYDWAAGDTDTAGQYSAQIRVRLTDGRDAYAPTDSDDWIAVVVREAL